MSNKYIVGIDEAGRGPLAGPVAVGVVLVKIDFDFHTVFPGLNDSKKLSEKKREVLFLKLQEEVRLGNVRAIVCLSNSEMIDAKGIVPSVSSALQKGLKKLMPNPEEGKVYLDGSLHAPKEYTQETIIGGDGIIPAIMLASVAAKVTRDRFMQNRIAPEYPEYGFEKHKGYGTAAHIQMIKKHGPSPVHRMSFLSNILGGSIPA